MINNLDWIKSTTSVTELIPPLLIGMLMHNMRFSHLVRAKLLYLLNNGSPNVFHWDNTTVEGLSSLIKIAQETKAIWLSIFLEELSEIQYANSSMLDS